MTDYQAMLALIRGRRSVREFTDRPVERADIERMVEAARWAPSNHNRQGWKFLVFQDRAALRSLADAVRAAVTSRLGRCGRLPPEEAARMVHYATLFAEAPCAVLVLHKRSVAIGREVLEGLDRPELVSGEPLSAAMAVQNLLLAAHCLGLGACVATAPLLAAEVWRDQADLPAGFEPTCVVAVGHPRRQPPPPVRKPLEQILELR